MESADMPSTELQNIPSDDPKGSPPQGFVARAAERFIRTLQRNRQRKTDRTDSNSEFISRVSLELKSPLNVIALYAELANGSEGREESFRQEATTVIRDEVQRLRVLLNNLLNLTRLEAGSFIINRQRVNLTDLIVDVFDACKIDAHDEKLTFEADLPEELGEVSIDKDLFRIALSNLLVNAISYSGEAGTITLSVAETDDTVRITVRDDGIGIAAEDQEHVFDKFVRGENAETQTPSGHGLGLALVKEIVQLHQGTVSVESELGKGTEFTIEIGKEAIDLKMVS